MIDMLQAMIHDARIAKHDAASLMATTNQIRISSKHHTPGCQAMCEAIALGEASIIQALVQSPRLDAGARQQLASIGLAAWARQPLASRQAVAIVQHLLEAGADPWADLGTPPAALRLAEALGTIEGGEQARQIDRKQSYQTGAGEILRGCWQAMEERGVDLGQAMKMRNRAQLQVPGIAQWRKQKDVSQVNGYKANPPKT